MSEGVLIALITAIGSFLGSIIPAFATVIAAKNKGNGPSVKSVFSGAIIGAFLTLGILFLLGLFPLSKTETPPATQSERNSTAFPLGGSWSGTIKSSDGSFSTGLNLSFDSSCKANEICRTYNACQISCSGTLTLIKQEGNSYIFLEKETTGADSCGFCYEHIQKLSGSSISYGCSGTGLSKDIQSTGVLLKP